MATREEKAWRHRDDQRALRQVRKYKKRNRKQKRVRQKDWMAEDWEAMASPERERILPLDENERRRRTWASVVERASAGEPSDQDTQGAASTGHELGLVVEVSTGLCRVELDRRLLLCDLRGSLSATETGFTNVVAVGDRVVVSEDGADRGVVEAVMPRQSALSRPDVFYAHLQQVVVANAEQLLVVESWRMPALWPELIDRYLIAAERYALRPIICLNKVDLASDPGECQAALRPYTVLGYRVLFTSALDRAGLEELREVLRDHRTVLAGLSGVGKSSLIAAIEPGLDLRIAEVSERRHEGRHTTAQVNLLRLNMGGWVVDTPGIREFGLSGLRRAELSNYYREFADAGAHCRYHNCAHLAEPECAVHAAVDSGAVSPMRYDNYCKIYESLPG